MAVGDRRRGAGVASRPLAVGHTLGIPFAQLLGGVVCDSFPALWTLASGDPGQEIEEAEAKLAARLRDTFKVKIGAQAPAADLARLGRAAACWKAPSVPPPTCTASPRCASWLGDASTSAPRFSPATSSRSRCGSPISACTCRKARASASRSTATACATTRAAEGGRDALPCPHGHSSAARHAGAEFDALKAGEKARAEELQRQGTWRHLWRIAGAYADVSIFDVADNDEPHAILSTLPLFPFTHMQVTPLARHPSGIG